MAITPVNLTFDLGDLLDNPASTVGTTVWIETNIPNDVIVDPDGNVIRLGDAKAVGSGGTGSVGTDGKGSFVGLVPTNAATNPTAFQYKVHVDYRLAYPQSSKGGGKGRAKWDSGWFSLTATSDLADVVAEQYVPPTWMTTAVETLQAKVDEGQALLDQQEQISGLTGEDEAVALLVNTPSSDTAAALTATIASEVATPGTPTNDGLLASTTALFAPADSVRINGDSLSDNLNASRLAALLGVTVTKGTHPGQASSDIALRAGAITVAVTVTGNSLPSSGAVAATVTSPSVSFRQDGSGTLSFTGTLDLDGTPPAKLVHSLTDGSWTAEQVGGTGTLSVPAGTTFRMTDADAYRADVNTFWVGRNNLNPGLVLNDVVRDTDLMVRHLSNPLGRYVVVGVTNALTEYAGASGVGTSVANYNAILALNSLLATRHGDRFLDIRRYLVDDALYALGINPTATDLANINVDTPPTSLHSSGPDSIHFSDTTCTYIEAVIAQKIRTLGMIPGAIPYDPPGAVTSLTAGTPTLSTIPLTWGLPTASGIVGVKIEAKKTSEPDSAYQIVGAATAVSGSFTVAGLSSPGTSYTVRVTTVSEAGHGSSATVVATTADTPPTVITSDSFNRANDSTIAGDSTDAAAGGTAKTWATTGGSCAIISNQLGRLDTSSTRFAYLDSGVTDHRVKVTLSTFAASTDMTLVVRRADASNLYRANISASGAIQLQKTVAGSTTSIGSAPAGSVVPGDTVGLRAQGTTIDVLVNGVVRLTVTDWALSAGTGVGLGLPPDLTHRFDDFYVYDK